MQNPAGGSDGGPSRATTGLRATELPSIHADIVERMPFGVAVWRLADDGETMILAHANSAAAGLAGFDRVQSIGRAMRELFPETAPEREALYAEVARTGHPRRLGEVPFKGIDGSQRWAASRIVPLDGRCAAVIFEDITEQKRALGELQRSEERFRTLIENSADAVAIVGATGRIAFMSSSVSRVLGYQASELEGRIAFDLVHPGDIDHVQSFFERVLANPGRPYSEQLRCRHKDGSWQHLEMVAVNRLDDPNLGGVVGNFRNVTSRVVMEDRLQRTQEELVQSQKMEAIGKLAGGIAHDFNNLLSIILGTSVLVLEKLREDDPVRAEIKEIQRAGERASDLTRQLLAFGRQQMLAPDVVDLNEVIGRMDRMLRRIIGEDIELLTRPAEELAHVRVDPGQIEQVIMNLVVNARDAMPQGGTLTIETGNSLLDASFAAGHPEVSPGRHVMLAISDTGTGMDKKTQGRIFEPFYTTKRPGQGTGLGLSTVFGIVKQSGGSIWVDSELDRGTTFKLYLPATTLEVTPSPARAALTPSQGSETILLVEDEPQVRAIVERILARRGYRVLSAVDADDALRICRAHEGPIQLLLTDVVMPRTSGKEVADQTTAIRPSMKVLYMSGYTDKAIVHHGVLDPGIAFLPKPVTPDALIQKVRDVLDS